MVRLDEYHSLRAGGADPASQAQAARLRHAKSPRPFAKHIGTPPPQHGHIMTYPDGVVFPTLDIESSSDNGSYVSSESKDEWQTTSAPVPVPVPPALATGMDPMLTSSQQYRRSRQQHQNRPLKTAWRSTDGSGGRKMVTFKNAYMPDIVPRRDDYVESYDDLIYRVGGLYHTLTGFIEPDWDPEYNGGDEELEQRSVTLMVAEFLFRSAVFLGYKPPPEQQAWLTGFRELKKFSTNDVRRWRRLAHHNWAKDESIIAPRGRPSANANGSAKRGEEHHVRNKMKKLFHHHHHRESSSDSRSSRSAQELDDDVDGHIDIDNPPMVPDTIDLTRLVAIANMSVYYGSYQFSERGIRKLCNRKID